MSALKSDFPSLFLYATSKLEDPWKTILPQLDTMSVDEMMRQIGTTSLDVAGVYVNGYQCNFEKIAERVQNTAVVDFLYTLFGLRMTCATGNINTYLRSHVRLEWVPWLLSVRISEEPIFVMACRRSLKCFVEWMVDIMQESSCWEACRQQNASGDTPLHIAVRRRQWDWAKWLIGHGAIPYKKNNDGDTPMSLAVPYHEKIDIFDNHRNSLWYDALHEALVAGRQDPTWCVALIDQGADFNQHALYDVPLDSLVVLAKHGMDMNLGPLPPNRSPEQLQIFYLYGRRPTHWQYVISAFTDTDWIRFLHDFYHEKEVELPELFKENIMNVRSITNETLKIKQKLL